MTLIGLHVVDVALICIYVVVIIWVGRAIGRKKQDAEGFYLAGRKLGKFYQFFLNFGHSTDSNQAAGVSREVYRQGLGGMWIQYLVLFLTPFYWFTTMLYRRARLITIGDLLTERFDSKFLGGAFAAFCLVLALIGGGASYMVAGKTMMALTPKAESEYTAEEAASVTAFREFRNLQNRAASGLEPAEQARYEELQDRFDRGELRGLVSHTDPLVFYIGYALVIAVYTMLGGFAAAAVTDAIQGTLIVVFSVMLIPIGLHQLGGFEGLHARVPDYMFELFGSAATSEYAWYTILAMVVANLISIIAAAPMMPTAGSAKDEMTARIGMLGGMFFKRFIMLFWALAGLIAIALYAGALDDPDQIWGVMTRQLLFPGAIGLMLVGVLAANMSSLDALSVSYSALVVRNLYQPLRGGQTEQHYLTFGRVMIAVILLSGIVSAIYSDSLLTLFQYFISLPAVFGAPIWLGFVWRRLTKTAVIAQVLICFTLYAVIPNAFPAIEAIRSQPALLAETDPVETTIVTGALQEDVDAGLADRMGEGIRKPHRIEPTGIYFEDVVRTDPADPNSRLEGRGRFHAEIWVLSWLGINFASCSKAQLVATRFFFDALFPFVLLFAISAFTKPVDKRRLDRFYGKLRTPVQATPEEDDEAVERAAEHPEEGEHSKLLPGSNWEVRRPDKVDVGGFGGSWLLVGVVLVCLWLLAKMGS